MGAYFMTDIKKSIRLSRRKIIWAVLAAVLCAEGMPALKKPCKQSLPAGFSLAQVAAYDASPSAVVNQNMPYFSAEEMKGQSALTFSSLDGLKRCGAASALIGPETLPAEKRKDAGILYQPSGWHTVRYDDLIEDRYLYNRCHLIAYELYGENFIPENLMTGTRYFNTQAMEPYENKTASFVRRTGKHVFYRVSPVFGDDDLVAAGVLMEACSVEDGGAGLQFCVFCYNVQPGIEIDYATGNSRRQNDS